ncbi:MAG: dihydrofolate reductase family protein [Acidimicrobiia bacterium]|nr:dihydrofolate reductase family protein [Acidimicrobiia bacterium]
MGDLVYMAIMSVDGYIEDEHGRFDWARPSDEVHLFVNELERDVRTALYGRRMYETMQAWETDESLATGDEVNREFAETWQATDKIVYSTTLEAPVTTRTRIERSFDPEAVRQLKASVDHRVSVGGPDLAEDAFAAGLVDEVQLISVPISVGGGKPALPRSTKVALELTEVRSFESGFVFSRYRVRS